LQLRQTFLEFLGIELGNNLPGLHRLTFGNGEPSPAIVGGNLWQLQLLEAA
jgi:hypothetical protein